MVGRAVCCLSLFAMNRKITGPRNTPISPSLHCCRNACDGYWKITTKMAPASNPRSNPVPSQEAYTYGYPADTYYVVLPPAPHLHNRRRSRRLLAYAASLVVSLGLFLGAAFYLFWPSQPGIQVIGVNFNNFSFQTASQPGSVVPRLFLNISMDMVLKVHNKDYYRLEYDSLDVGLGYRGRRIGVVESEGGYLPARHTAYVNSTLDLDGIEVLHDVVYLLKDLVSKELPLDTVAAFNGSVSVLFTKIPIEEVVSCEVVVNPDNQTILSQDCGLG